MTTTSTTAANAALLAAKNAVTQAQSDQHSAQNDTLKGQNGLIQAQLAAEKALTAQRQAQDNFNAAHQQIATLTNRLTVMRAIPAPGAPHTAAWNNLIDQTNNELTQAQARLVVLQTALANATAQIATDNTAATRAQGVLDQLQKDEQKANDKLQQAIQSLLNQVQASATATSSTKVVATPANPTILASALAPMYISPWGTPIGLYQPASPSLWTGSPCTQVVQGMQSMPPGCDPVPRVPVCTWTPGVLGATPIGASAGVQTVTPAVPDQGAPPPAAAPGNNHAKARSLIPTSNTGLEREDAFASLPRVQVIDIDLDELDRDVRNAEPESPEPRAEPYQNDYRFDLPARFALAQYDPNCPGRSYEGQGALIHEGMRILTRKDGEYDVRFNVTVPAMPVTMRLQLLLYENDTSPFPKSLTLPPIRIAARANAKTKITATTNRPRTTPQPLSRT